MASTTFGGIIRSTGDNKKTSSAGSAQLAIKFRFAHDSSGAAVVKDASDSSAVVLPAGAIVDAVYCKAALNAGTWDLGVKDYDGGADITDPDAIVDGAANNLNSMINAATSTIPGARMLDQQTYSEQATVTATVTGAASGNVYGVIYYHLDDNGNNS
tara:strand:- start:904 stop:1374 length:471 start_codon:yes stop_codon:yes gene_type:complete